MMIAREVERSTILGEPSGISGVFVNGWRSRVRHATRTPSHQSTARILPLSHSLPSSAGEQTSLDILL